MDGKTETFDHVVFAVHANQALSLLGDEATVLEKRILGSFQTSRNDIALHLDPTVNHSSYLFFQSSNFMPGSASQGIGPGSLERCDTEHASQPSKTRLQNR